MRRAAIWMGILMMVLPLCAAFAAEPQVELTAPGLGVSTVACGEAATQVAPLAVLEREIFAPADTRPTDMANPCCSVGCCTYVESGCEYCNGGRRWYTKYSCPSGGTCTVRPSNCPTPC